MKIRSVPKQWAICLVVSMNLLAFGAQDTRAADLEHFDPLGKPPSEHALKAIAQDSAGLPFDDKRDFDEAGKGFIAEPDSWKVVGPEGNVVWDLARYDFFRTGENLPSVHPSLQRVSRLNMKVGLFEVKPGFYQVRGFDLANITFIEGKTGWIVFDPLTAPEPAAAAKKLVDKHFGERPVVAVVYSHSHVDHWGGVRGIVDEADVRAGKVQIIAPRDFMVHAVSENVFAGNAMNRRVMYQYGVLLPASPFGHAGQGLNMNVANGNTGLIQPRMVQ
jgi:alkyl sulfatase BDS1-like metallo-beta-lactamase superfamily hydrolase